MSIPIYKKSIFEKMGITHQDIANKIKPKDRVQISILIERFIKHKDARGNWQIPRKEGMELLPYFQNYVDSGARSNIFGCGGCATKMVNYMHEVYKIWQNPTK